MELTDIRNSKFYSIVSDIVAAGAKDVWWQDNSLPPHIAELLGDQENIRFSYNNKQFDIFCNNRSEQIEIVMVQEHSVTDVFAFQTSLKDLQDPKEQKDMLYWIMHYREPQWFKVMHERLELHPSWNSYEML